MSAAKIDSEGEQPHSEVRVEAWGRLSFPPFFTLQPVESTREKQLALWRELILSWAEFERIHVLTVHDCPLWKNSSIQRQLNGDEITTVLDSLVQMGHGEWPDKTDRTRCRILTRTAEQLATDIYTWASTTGHLGSVCTLYELHSGEDVSGMSFEGIDEHVLRRALAVLENQGKCTIFKGDTSEEDGIKFS